MAGLSSTYPQYAPAEDLNAYLGETLTDADPRLQEASGAVRVATKTAFYGVAADGFTPIDTTLSNAYHDAAILQAAAVYRAGIKPGDTAAVAAQVIQSKSLGARSVTYAQDSTATEARAALLGGALAPLAVAVLESAGLLSSAVSTGGGMDYDILARKWVSA